MHFIERIQIQSTRQRKIPLPKKFWSEFPIHSLVKIELLNTPLDIPPLFFVDRVQAQGTIQRRISLPQKFWQFFPKNSLVKVELMRKPSTFNQILTTITQEVKR